MAVSFDTIISVGDSSSVVTLTTAAVSNGASVGDSVIIATVSGSGSSTYSSLTDSAGNTYVRDGSSNVTNARAAIWRLSSLTNAIIAGTTTFSLATSGASVKGLVAFRLKDSHLVGFLPADKAGASATGTSTTPTTSTSGVLSLPAEFVVALYTWASADTFAETAGWTNPAGAGSKVSTTGTINSVAIQIKETTATTALNPQATIGASVLWGGQIQSYFYTTGKQPLVLNNYQNFSVGDGMSVSEKIR